MAVIIKLAWLLNSVSFKSVIKKTMEYKQTKDLHNICYCIVKQYLRTICKIINYSVCEQHFKNSLLIFTSPHKSPTFYFSKISMLIAV